VCPGDPTTREFAAFLINQFVRCLLWADDLVLFSTSVGNMQQQLNALANYCDVNKLRVNESKTKVMYISTRNESAHVFNYKGTQLGNVACFKYVGAWIDSKGTSDVQATEIIKKA